MLRVLRDLLRQFRWVALMLAAVFTAAEVAMLRHLDAPHAVTMLNYCALVTNLMCVMIVTTSLELTGLLRPIAALPIRRRDLGKCLWLIAVGGPVILTLLTKLLVVGIARVSSPDAPIRLPWVLMSSLFDAAYVGTVRWRIQNTAGPESSTPGRRWLDRLSWTVAAIVLLAGTVALGLYMPETSDEWHWPIALALAGMLSLTVIGFRQSERLAVYGATRHLLFDTRSTEGRRELAPVARSPFDNRLSGLRRMLWLQFRNALIVSGLTMSILSVMDVFPLSKTIGFWEQLQQTLATLPSEVGLSLWVLPLMLYLTIGLRRWQPAKMRPMRALPISARELNLLLLLRPVVTWAAFWLVLLALYSLSLASAPAWMGFGWLVGAIGLTGLAGSALWRWQYNPFAYLLVAGVQFLMFVRPWTHVDAGVINAATPQVVGLVLGICLILAAIRWNDRLIHSKGTGR